MRARALLAAACALLVITAAVLLRARSDAPSAELILGEGAHRYRWVDGWTKLPAGDALGYTHGGVAVDSRGRVYLCTDTERAVMVFEPDGKYVGAWGAELAGGLHGIAIAREAGGEFVYLAHIRLGEVLKATLDGEILWRLGAPMESGLYEDPSQYHPTSVAVSGAGEVFAADGYGLKWIHRYDAEQRYLGSFGGLGTEPGRMKNPHGIWLHEGESGAFLVVADRENGRIQILDLDGTPRRVLTESLLRPAAVRLEGDVLAVADIEGVVTLLSLDGVVLARLGANADPEGRNREDVPRARQVAGTFVSPHALAFGPAGSLFVADWLLEGRLTKLEPLAR